MATPEEEARQQEQQRRAAAAAVAGGTLVVVGDPSVPAPDAPSVADRAATAGKILAALIAYLAVQRARMRVWLTEQMRRRQPSASQADIERLLDEEEGRQAEFERRQAERFSRDLTTALAIPDAARREGAIRGLVKREEQYTRQRETAMAARAFAALDRVVLRSESPMGAFWKLDPTVIEHTAGCLIMGGKFWPWAVLDRLHPPRHAGCPCRLIGYGEAIASGLMAPGAVSDVRTAIRAAAGVVMEGVQLGLHPDDEAALVEMGELAESEALREALIAQGLATEESLDELEEAFNPEQARWPVGHPRAGQWRPKVGGVVGGPTQEMFETEIGELRAMAAPRKIGTTRAGDAPAADLFERSKPQHEVEAIGAKIAELADRYSTLPAYQARIDALAAERKAISDKFWERVGDLDGYQEKYDALKAEGVEDAIDELNARYYTDAERARQRAINAEVVRLSKAKELAHRDALVGILAHIRPMGGRANVRAIEQDEKFPMSPAETREAFERTLADVSRVIPTAWWQDVNAKGGITFRASSQRAWHLSDEDGGGSTIRVHPEKPATVLHELAHRFEAHYGEENAAGFLPLLGPAVKFRESRVKPQERTVAMREVRPGHGYEGNERAFEDEFAEPYMGKVYLADRATEILTMGMERVFYPPYGSRDNIDEQMRAFILGLMATV